MTEGGGFRVVEARAAGELAACRELFQEYQRELRVSLCFQGFEQELAALPGEFAQPSGGLWLATAQSEAAGCVALRKLAPEIAEMKRLYVRPAYRGRHLGLDLANTAIDAAARLGYRMLKLDTLPTLHAAQKLYRRLGFVDTPPYNDNPIAGVRFMALELDPG